VSLDAPAHPDTAGREKLPVIATCIAGYRSLYDEWDSFVRLAAWPFIWLVAIQIAGQSLAKLFKAPALASLIDLPYLLLIPFAVAWLRMLMLGERPESFQGIRFGRTELRFLAYVFLIPLVSYLPAILLGGAALVIREPMVDHVFLLVTTLLALSGGAYLSMRLWLVFPEIAIDKFNGLSESWHMAKGAVSRICAIAMIVELPLIIIGIPFIFFQAVTGTGLIVNSILQVILALLSSAVYRAAQATAYRHLTQGRTEIRAG